MSDGIENGLARTEPKYRICLHLLKTIRATATLSNDPDEKIELANIEQWLQVRMAKHEKSDNKKSRRRVKELAERAAA